MVYEAGYRYQKILLVSGSIAHSRLIIEICAQIDRTIQVDAVPNEGGVVPYLLKNELKRPPGLVIFAGPPVTRQIAWLVDDVHKNPLSRDIPVSFILFPLDAVLMKEWVKTLALCFITGRPDPAN